MNHWRRRDLLGCAGAALTAAALPIAGCKKSPPKRHDVLAALVLDFVVPDTQAVLAQSRALEAETATLLRAPAPKPLAQARARWKDALLAWKQALCFRNGPLLTTSAFLRSLFSPIRPLAVDNLVRGRAALDDASVRELGVDQKGLFALEHLLFDPGTSALLLEQATEAGERSRRLTALLAKAVVSTADDAALALGDGRLYAEAFARNGQDSVALVCNQLVDTVEGVASGRLTRLLGTGARPLRPGELEGEKSGMALTIALALISGSERLYAGKRGGGLADSVRAVSPAIDERARTAFARAASALAPLTAPPLSRALAEQRPAIDEAARAARELQAALKVDVASALGVTLVFAGPDGD